MASLVQVDISTSKETSGLLHLARGSTGFTKLNRTTTGPKSSTQPSDLLKDVAGSVASSRSGTPQISALLDREQWQILHDKSDQPLLILGGAGCGKTTVALHRLALLSHRQPKRYRPETMLVVVPEPGLVRLTVRLLDHLGLPKVQVSSFDTWAESQARRLFRGLPKRVCQVTPPAVVRVKRSLAMFKAVDRLIKVKRIGLIRAMDDQLHGSVTAIPEIDNEDLPLLDALGRSEQTVLAKLPEGSWKRQAAIRFFGEQRLALFDHDFIRSFLFGNWESVANSVDFSRSDLVELERHTRRQYEEGRQFQGLTEIDDQQIAQDAIAGTIDTEDFALLMYTVAKLTGRVRGPRTGVTERSHLLIDEAQDLAPVELEVLGRTLQKDGSITVAGDAAQQSDPSIAFDDWQQTLSHLGIAGVESVRLTTNYRCPKPIADFGQQVLGSLAPKVAPQTVRSGAPVLTSYFADSGLAALSLIEALEDLVTSDRQGCVAIITVDEDQALATYRNLHQLNGRRLVTDGNFSFEPGIDITTIAQVKGLEFDYVVIWDVNSRSYPDQPTARRALHIAATRAIHQLWVISIGSSSPLLP